MTADASAHEVLGVSPHAGQDEIKAAYRRLSRQTHPDTGGSGALFRQVTEAYEALTADATGTSARRENDDTGPRADPPPGPGGKPPPPGGTDWRPPPPPGDDHWRPPPPPGGAGWSPPPPHGGTTRADPPQSMPAPVTFIVWHPWLAVIIVGIVSLGFASVTLLGGLAGFGLVVAGVIAGIGSPNARRRTIRPFDHTWGWVVILFLRALVAGIGLCARFGFGLASELIGGRRRRARRRW